MRARQQKATNLLFSTERYHILAPDSPSQPLGPIAAAVAYEPMRNLHIELLFGVTAEWQEICTRHRSGTVLHKVIVGL